MNFIQINIIFRLSTRKDIDEDAKSEESDSFISFMYKNKRSRHCRLIFVKWFWMVSEDFSRLKHLRLKICWVFFLFFVAECVSPLPTTILHRHHLYNYKSSRKILLWNELICLETYYNIFLYVARRIYIYINFDFMHLFACFKWTN